MVAKAKTNTMEYVDKAEVAIHREKKTQVIERSLEKLQKKHGIVSAQLLLDEASDPNHELHSYFEWDDAVAANRMRLNQAYQMICCTRFVLLLQKDKNGDQVAKIIKGIENKERKAEAIPVRKYLPMNSNEKGAFIQRQKALAEAESRSAFIERKVAVLRSWCNQVADIKELTALRTGVTELLKTEFGA